MFWVELEIMDLDFFNMYFSILEEIKVEIVVDFILLVLCVFVVYGWFFDKLQVFIVFCYYYLLRDELVVYYGVLYKLYKVFIFMKLQFIMLKKFYYGYQGGESMICWV